MVQKLRQKRSAGKSNLARTQWNALEDRSSMQDLVLADAK